ncbi:uncharacterized protein LOC114286943 [Camellia sinensis]|uniref:uncharacterized protein LOC114286943 n=1 Tax=Camellia sinensis TaxID=4442 RepID=UPI001035F55B|nr:uncharacterized protein LOC114286943 [Camellia sinensis]
MPPRELQIQSSTCGSLLLAKIMVYPFLVCCDPSERLAGEACSNKALRLKKEKKTTDVRDLLFEREERNEETREETKKLCCWTSSELVRVDDGTVDSHCSESAQSSSNGESGTPKKIVASVAAAAVAGGVLVGSSSSGLEEQKGNKKLMVAPGSGGASHIPRKDFENDPASYFRNHHLKSGR